MALRSAPLRCESMRRYRSSSAEAQPSAAQLALPTGRCSTLRERSRRRRGDAAASAATEATEEETVAAIVTPVVPQAGGVAIVRLSGSRAVDVVRRIFRPGRTGAHAWSVESHRAVYGSVVDGDGAIVDEARPPSPPPPSAAAAAHARRPGARAAHAQAALVHARGRRGGALPRGERVRAARPLALPGAPPPAAGLPTAPAHAATACGCSPCRAWRVHAAGVPER